MNERCMLILKEIALKNDFVRITDLARKFNVSPRTILYDLDKIDYFLKENNLPCLIRKPKNGITIQDDINLKNKVLSFTKNLSSSYYVYTPEERKVIILITLFNTTKYTTIDYLSNLLGVSRGTIVKDLETVEKWLASKGLILERVPHYGLKIRGKESNIRQVIMILCLKNRDVKEVIEALKNPQQVEEKIDEYIKQFFEGIDIGFIERVVKPIEGNLDIPRRYNIYYELILYLAVAIKRIQMGYEICEIEEGLGKLKITAEYLYIINAVKQLEENLNIKFSEPEIMHTVLYSLTGKLTLENFLSEEDWIKIETVIIRLIYNIKVKLNFNFNIDTELCKGLSSHLFSAICSLKYDLPLINPMLNLIKRRYSNIYKIVKNSIKVLEEFLDQTVPADEIGFITLHFAAAIERNKINIEKVYNLLIVTGSGFTNTQILISRLKAEFKNIQIIGIVSPSQVEQFTSLDNIDIIISTVPLRIENVPLVIVNPLLLHDDISKIRKLLKNRRVHNFNDPEIYLYESNIVEKLVQIIERNCVIKNRLELKENIKIFFAEIFSQSSRMQEPPLLKKLLTPKTIKSNVEVKNLEEAIRESAQMLVKNGFVTSKYVEALIRIANKVGHSMVIAPNVSILHAWPKDGVKQFSLSLITLKSPIKLGEKDTDLIKAVITIGTIDNFSHLKVVLELMNVFMNNEKANLIINAKKIEDIINAIGYES